MQILSDAPYRNALAALAVEIGLDPHELAEREELVIDNIPVALRASQRGGAQGIEMACKVGSLQQPPLSLLRVLLQANTLGLATHGATLGLQCGRDDLVLASAHPLDTPPTALARACLTLAQTAAVWSAAFDAGLAQAEAISTPPDHFHRTTP